MEGEDKPSTIFCTVVAMDPTSFCYRVCAVCERTLPEKSGEGASVCGSCDLKAFNPGSSGSKRLFRILLSVASETKVFVVVCFDRCARVLFGRSADEVFEFAKLNPFAVETAAKLLEGEMFQMTLSKPRNSNAQHMRVASVVPLRSNFCPVMETLKRLYRQVGSSS